VLAMPRVRAPAPPAARRGRGHPPNADAKPISLIYAAYLKDVKGLTYFEIGPMLLLDADERNRRSKGAQRYVADGRLLLHRHGIAPWALWKDGKLSPHWWLERRFRDAIAEWATRPIPSIFEEGWGRPTDVDELCPPVPVTDGDRAIARHVGVMDALNGGDQWREGLTRDELFRQARETESRPERDDALLARRLAGESVSKYATMDSLPDQGSAVFFSRCRNMRYVIEPERAFVIPASETGAERRVKPAGRAIQFEHGRYDTADADEIDFLSKHRDFGRTLFAMNAELLQQCGDA